MKNRPDEVAVEKNYKQRMETLIVTLLRRNKELVYTMDLILSIRSASECPCYVMGITKRHNAFKMLLFLNTLGKYHVTMNTR